MEGESGRVPRSVNGILVNRHGSISGTEELKEILNGHEAQLRQKMDEAKDMESFLIELVDTLVTKQLDALGWHKITQLSQDLSQVQIELRDASKRRHLLTVTFPPGHPTVPLIMEPLEIPKSESEHGLAMDFMSTTSSSRQGLELEGVIQQAEEFYLWALIENSN
ncbi:hypothetical protein BGX28_001908 [Mortierella sp. GBA30]|nr:hypothetical protein BGX28_001908 [Mortierella sp. GBA30]